MKTHTQYPYQITTVEQFIYAEENNLISEMELADEPEGSYRVKVIEQMFDQDEAAFTLVPKTLDELEVGDVVEFLKKTLTVKFFGKNIEFYSEESKFLPFATDRKKNLTWKTFPHPLPIDLFPILDKE